MKEHANETSTQARIFVHETLNYFLNDAFGTGALATAVIISDLESHDLDGHRKEEPWKENGNLSPHIT